MKIEFKPEDYSLQDILFVFALESEAGHHFDGCQTLFTGIGKVNAAYALTKYLQHHQPKLIVNLGTAGSVNFKRGELVCCTKFVQRDMDVTGLGFEKYKTPFSNEETVLYYGLKMNGLQESICGTGDNFETNHSTNIYHVLDMEAYALVSVAKRENIPFLCVKYISDGADDSAAEDWTEQVKLASEKLRSLF